MILLILGFIAGVVIYMKKMIVDGSTFTNILFTAAFGLIGALATAMVVLVLTQTVVPDTAYSSEQVSEQKIVALKNDDGDGDSKFIFTGTANNTTRYYYATEDDLGIHINGVDAERTYIRTDANPRVQRLKYHFKNWYTWIYALPTARDSYVIYVPDGTNAISLNK